jgi:hypothetical protein
MENNVMEKTRTITASAFAANGGSGFGIRGGEQG